MSANQAQVPEGMSPPALCTFVSPICTGGFFHVAALIVLPVFIPHTFIHETYPSPDLAAGHCSVLQLSLRLIHMHAVLHSIDQAVYVLLVNQIHQHSASRALALYSTLCCRSAWCPIFFAGVPCPPSFLYINCVILFLSCPAAACRGCSNCSSNAWCTASMLCWQDRVQANGGKVLSVPVAQAQGVKNSPAGSDACLGTSPMH